MTVVGIHATAPAVASQILASGFKPGTSLANYLGGGAYFYVVHGDGGYENAIACATKVAGRRYDRPAVLASRISVDNALNLQNPAIRPLFAEFGACFDRRVSDLRVHVEPNDNVSYYRPVSHLTIEAFRHCIEAVGDRAFDVLSARFALKSRDIDIELPHEICVKRARAILSTERCGPTAPAPLPSSDPATWPCTDATVRAAQEAVQLIARMDDRDLAGLIFSIYQGSDNCWDGSRPLFRRQGALHALHDSRHLESGAELARAISEVGRGQGRTIHLVDLARVAAMNTPAAQAAMERVIQSTDGIIALYTPADAEVLSLLLTVAEKRPEVPALVFLANSRDERFGGAPKAPIMLRSRHNLCCATMPPREELGELVRGFLHDRWTDGLAVLDIESKMAARHGSAEARHRDARRIVEAYHARQQNLL